MAEIKYYGLESHFNENVTFYKNVNIQGNLNYDSLTIRNLNVQGQSTFGITTTTSLSAQSLNVSGVSTLGTVQVSSGIITATSGIVTYYGDGSRLSLGSTSTNQVIYNNAENVLSGSNNLTFDGTTLTAAAFKGTLQRTSTINLGGQPTAQITGISTWANEITILFSNVNLGDAGHFIIYVLPADSGGTAHLSNSTFIWGGVSSGRVTSSSALIFYLGSASNIITGQITLKKHIRVSGNHRWVASGTFIYENASDYQGSTYGYAETTAALPISRLLISSTTVFTMTSGEVSVLYQ